MKARWESCIRDKNSIMLNRELIKERDMYTCQICGGTLNPEGHHIIDFQYGGLSDKDNIVTLCNEHHKKVHKNQINIIKF